MEKKKEKVTEKSAAAVGRTVVVWMILSSTMGGLLLGWWEWNFHSDYEQLWMVPLGLILLVTPIIAFSSVIISGVCCISSAAIHSLDDNPAQLQKILMYLAAIADAQPQAPAMPPQMASHPTLQQGGYYMAQQPGFFPPKMPFQFAPPHQIADSLQQLQHQGIQGPMGMRSMGSNTEIHPSHSHHMESSGGNKRGDSVEVGAAAADGGVGGLEAAQGSGKGEELK